MVLKKSGSVFLVAFMLILLSVTFVSAQDEGAPVLSQWAWQEAKIQSVFDLLSRASGNDFVLDPDVSGTVTLNVKNKSWKEVVNIVCNMYDLVSVPEDNYIFIIKKSTYYNRIKKSESDKKSLEALRDLKKVVIKLKHTTASEMMAPVRGLLTPGRGKLTSVEHTNSLIIHDTPENMPVIEALIEKLDVEVLQISIAAKIMEVSENKQRELGIQWNLFDNHAQLLPTTTGVSNVLGKFSYGILSPQAFSATLEYLFSDGKTNIVAQPQITTLDNKEATITMGSQVPFNKVDQSGNSSLEMISIQTGLQVTPHVTGDGKIMIDVAPQKESYDVDGNGNIIKKNQTASTTVIVHDGETIAIAGLTSDEKSESSGGVPLLKDIPVLGYLFKKSKKTHDKKDLVIFVTPHIIRSEASSETGSTQISDLDKAAD